MHKDMPQFQLYWSIFQQKALLTPKQSQSLFDLLFHAYTEPQRHYHTIQHIVECLSWFHEIKHCLSDPLSVELALWFHDVIYEPQAHDNEVLSAELMLKSCSDLSLKINLAKVAEWILATQHHQLIEDDQDLAFILDIDLSILGSPFPRFLEYEFQIQQEYNWVEPKIYAEKRAQILQSFLKQEPLYQTLFFQKKCMEQARNNCGQLIKSIHSSM